MIHIKYINVFIFTIHYNINNIIFIILYTVYYLKQAILHNEYFCLWYFKFILILVILCFYLSKFLNAGLLLVAL